jgi:hypothetical protein
MTHLTPHFFRHIIILDYRKYEGLGACGPGTSGHLIKKDIQSDD